MGASGIRRKVDDLGRVVIPASIRRSLNIREGDAVEVSVDGERVILTKPVDACVFCGLEDPDLTAYRNRLVCPDCLGSLGTVAERAHRAHDLRSSRTAATEPSSPRLGASPGTPAASPGTPAAALPPWDTGAAAASRPAPRPVPRPVRAAREEDTRSDGGQPGAVDDATRDGRQPRRDDRYDSAATTAW